MRFSVFTLVLLALLVFATQGIRGESSLMELEIPESMLIRRQEAVAHGQTSKNATKGGSEGKTATTTTTAKKATSIWASPAILQDGTLFYIAISISALLWCTGKGVDMTLDQQERQAEYQARR